MSSLKITNLTCPGCNAEGEFKYYASVNVTLDPDLRDKIMDGSLFRWTCPSCGKVFNVPYPFLYHDMTRGFMLMFDPGRTHIIPFAEQIRVLENGLDIRTVYSIESDYMESHPKMNLLFDGLSDGKDLIFTVQEMPDRTWVPTDRKHTVSFEDYQKVKDTIK